MRALLLAVVAVAASAQLQAQSAPPAPQVTVGAGLKSIRLDWDPVTNVSRYEVWYRAHATSAYSKTADYLPATTQASFRISVHTLDWAGARYRIAACNSAGCTNSREIPVDSMRLDAPGYFKSSQPEVAESYGSDVDLAPNGAYLVAAAPNDDANGVGNAGAAYVLRRSGETSWSQRARLLPAVIQSGGGAGMRVAISADGNTVAMGLPRISQGEVYVFHYNGSSWQRTRIEAARRGSFGAWVSLDDAGKVLAIGRETGAEQYLFTNGAWAVRQHIEDRTSPADNCPNGEISGNGRVLVEQCFNGSSSAPTRSYLRIHTSYASARRDHDFPPSSSTASADRRYGLALDLTGDTIAAQYFNGGNEVDIFERVSGWHTFKQRLAAGSWQNNHRSLFGEGLSLSSNGLMLAVGDSLDVAQGTGVQRGTLQAGSSATGAVYLFTRNSSGVWGRQSVIKPSYLLGPGGGAAQTFGASLALSESGGTLAVGQPLESSDAVGIDGAWNNTRRSQSGAVWLY